MWDPQVKLKGGIIRVNIDLGMIQEDLFLAHSFRHMVQCGVWFCMPGKYM